MGYRNVWQYPWGWQDHPSQGSAAGRSEEASPGVGELLPETTLAGRLEEGDAAYLGIEDGVRRFTLSDVRADYLLLELFDQMCLTCQEDLVVLTDFFINPGRTQVGRLKVIGLDVGGVPRKVTKFRRNRKIPFPLFADDQRRLFHSLGQPDLPTAYLLLQTPEGPMIDMVLPGGLKTRENLEGVMEPSGLN